MATPMAELRTVIEVVMGQAPGSKDCNREGIGTPFVKVGEFGEERPVIREWTTDPKKLATSQDVLLCVVGATCGKINLGENCAIGRSVAALRPVEGKITQRYLFYFMQSKVPEFRAQSQGAAQTVISKDMILRASAPIPPIPEQKRIVAILDQAFADIDKARALTEQNLKNVRELFESTLQQVFSQGGEGWQNCTLGDIAEFKNGLNYSRSSKGEVIKVAGVKDFQANYSIASEEFDSVQIDGTLDHSYELHEGDILTVRSNGNKRLIGRSVLIENLASRASFSGFIIRIRLYSDKVSPAYLTHFLKSPKVHELLIGSGGGANISNLNQKTLTSLPVAFPALPDQIALCDTIQEMRDQSEQLTGRYIKKLEWLDELKKSLLQEAFSGELTKAPAEAAA